MSEIESDQKKETPPPSQQNPSEADKTKDFTEAVNGDEKAFERAFNGKTARVDNAVLQRIAAIRGFKLSVSDKDDAISIQHVNKDGLFNFEEFLDIIKLLEEPGEADQTKNIGEKLKKAGEEKEIVLQGKEGVGKTWMAREVAARAVRDRKGGFDFDVAIWLYLDRDYKGLSLHESIAYQLSVLADFEESETEEAKKREKADEAKKKEPKKKDKAGVAEVVEEIEKKKLEGYIHKALKGKKLLLIMDGKGSRVEAKLTFEIKKSRDQKEKDKSGDHGHKGEEGEKSSSEGGEKKVEEITEVGVEEKERGGENKQDQKEDEKEKKVLVLELMQAAGVVKARVELGCLKSYKSLITTRDEIDKADDEYRIMVKPFTWNDSKSLASRVMERERVDKIKEVEELAHYFMFRSERLPAQLLLISRIVSYFAKVKEGIQKLQNDRELLKTTQGTKVLDVLIKGYERLPKSVLIDRYSPETPEGHFLHRGRKVSYNELICYWIMEGHLGHFDRVEKAYMEGHRVLMELLNCGLLQKQEADYVVATSGATVFNLDIHDYKDFFRGIRPGLAVTFDMRLGKVALADGMIKTVERFSQDEKNDKIISTLLLDGNLIGEAEPPAQTLNKYKDQVEVLAISEPTSHHFKLPILEMPKLRLLALRGCQFLGRGQEAGSLECFFQKKSADEDLNKAHLDPAPSQEDKHTPRMEGLTFLEISGRTSLEYIPDKLFSLMPNLKTLNMSYLVNIESLPPSFYLLTEIEFLILRGCESLIELKSLKNFKDLKVLDVSEAKNFEKFEDKSLHSNRRLQVLNLSKTKLKTLPLINQLNELKYVWLSDCTELPRIRKIDRMEKLQILDISGAAQVERFCDPSLEDLKRLVIVDISRTAIKRLPANIGDPKYLYANNCHKLKVVPPVEGIEKLQVLNLSGCQRLEEVRKEFFTSVKGLRELDLSKTHVKELSFLPYLLSLRSLLLSECQHLKKLEKLSDLKELEFLDLSGCLELKELEDGSFDKMTHLQRLYLSGTGLGGQQKPLPSLAKLKNLKELLVRDCPNLTKLPDMDQLTNLEVLDCSGTVLESPPSLSNWDKQSNWDKLSNLDKQSNGDKQIHIYGAGIKNINTSQLIESLGATQKTGTQGANWEFKYKEVSECKWNISNWRIEGADDKDKLGTNVYGVHFLRLLKEYPSFLTEYLSTFRFLICPSKARFPKDFKDSYIDELILRDIYFQQICDEKMETCLEIRGFEELPISLRPLIARAQFIVLVEGSFLKSLIDLGVGRSMAMKACWIESCNELEHVVDAAEIVKEVEQSLEAAKSEGEQRKNVVAGKGEGDQHKKIAAKKSGELAKSKADQQKIAAAAKLEEAAKSEGDQQKNAVEEKSQESTKSENDQQKNVVAESSSESTKGEGSQQKSDAAETSGESAKSEGDQQKSDVVADNSTESTKGEGDQHKSDAATEKSGESAKSQDKNAVSDSSGESAKSEDDQQKSDVAADEKSEESAKSEGNQQKSDVAAKTSGESPKSEGDQQKSDVATEKSGESTKSEDDQQKHAASASSGESAKGEGDQQKSDVAAADKSRESAKSEGDQPKNAGVDSSGESTKGEDDQQKSESEGDQQKNVAAHAEKSGDEAKSEGHQQKNAAADNSANDQKREDDQQKSIVADKTEESAKDEGDQQTEKSQEHVKTQVESLASEADEKLKNFAEDLNKLESLWISDVWKLKSVCKGDIQSVSFKSLKALYLEHCPELSVICSSSLQLEALETLYIKYCHGLKTLFSDDNPSKMEKLRKMQLWGLDSLEKIGCKAPNLYKLRVGECPLLEHVIASRQTQGEEEVTTENEGHGNLEVLHIKSCDKLKSIFDSSQEDVHFEKLTELELVGLPRLQRVAREASALRVLIVGDCPSLESIIAGPTGLPNLETLEVKSCEKMKTIVQGAAQSKLEKLKKMELLGLPLLENIGAKLLIGDKACNVRACPKLNHA